MGTPASLLDLIARGGSIPGYNEAQQSQANIARTQAETANLPIEGQLRTAQTEAQQLANQRAQQQLKDEELYRQALAASVATQQAPVSGPDTSTAPPSGVPPIATPGFVNGPGGPPKSAAPSFYQDPVAFAMGLASKGASGGFVSNLMTQGINLQKAILAMPAEQRAAEDARLVPVQRILEGIAQIPEGPAQQQAYADGLAKIKQIDPHVAAGLPPQFDKNSLTRAIAEAGALKQHLDFLKTGQETATSAATAEKEIAEGKEATAKTGQIEFENDLLKGLRNPGTLEARAEAIVPAAENPDIHQQLVRDLSTATSREAIQEAQTKAAGLALARSPQSIEAKAKESAAVERANLPFREDAARDIAQYSSGLEQNREATKLIQGALEDYKSADSAINGVKSVIADAKSGNAVSGSQAPGLAAAASLAMFNIKRLPGNVTESMGTTYQKGLGALKSLADGVPQTTEKLDEIDRFLDLVKDANTNRYNGVKESVESTYKGVKAPDVSQTSAKSPFGVPEVHDPAEYKKLAKGAKYSQNGVVYVKQ